MQTAEVVLSVLRERGRKGLPCTQLYRQLFNRELYLLAYGNIYSNKGAMTPGVSEETADGTGCLQGHNSLRVRRVGAGQWCQPGRMLAGVLVLCHVAVAS
jgi:hypothetical protein